MLEDKRHPGDGYGYGYGSEALLRVGIEYSRLDQSIPASKLGLELFPYSRTYVVINMRGEGRK